MAFREACIGPIRTITSMGSDRAFLLNDAKNIQLFSELSHGTHSAGTVGTLAEQQN